MNETNCTGKEIPCHEMRQKALWLKTRKGVVNAIVKRVRPLTGGIFRDSDWSAVREVWKAMEELGMEVTVDVRDGGYFSLPGSAGGLPSGKEYFFSAAFENIERRRFSIEGKLVCSFCGTVSDPMECYDMSFIVF